MSIHVLATYRGGVIEPDEPLDLPDNTQVNLILVPVTAHASGTTDERPGIPRPSAPRISPAELADRVARHAVSVGSLPPDFARADIYRDRN